VKENLREIDLLEEKPHLLWLAINGDYKRAQYPKKEFANYETIKLLIEKGIDINKKQVGMSPLYSSIYHRRPDIARLLLMNNANANDFSVIRSQNKLILCDLPLNVAIRTLNVKAVEILLMYGALFNATTMAKIDRKIVVLKKKSIHKYYNIKVKKLKAILELLESHYSEEHEEKVDEYINKFKKTVLLNNYFPCFQELKDVINASKSSDPTNATDSSDPTNATETRGKPVYTTEQSEPSENETVPESTMPKIFDEVNPRGIIGSTGTNVIDESVNNMSVDPIIQNDLTEISFSPTVLTNEMRWVIF